VKQRLSLLFVSPRFLFPVDSGGKIRTTQILRGMKQGRFDIILASPMHKGAINQFASELEAVSDRFVSWPAMTNGLFRSFMRMRHLISGLPIPVATDRSDIGYQTVASELAKRPDVAVFDFPHSAVLAPQSISVPSVMFTHNVEAEIFQRHKLVSINFIKKMFWDNQLGKMQAYECEALNKFEAIVAVSERDKITFEEKYKVKNVSVIRTGVDLEFFDYKKPDCNKNVVFTGSMDWLANIDGINFLMDEVWPLVVKEIPRVSMTVVGRSPPRLLIEKARSRKLQWEFTGFVEDVRPYVHKSAVSVIPLRIGGGTRLKVFEAMAMGCPVVSTPVGVEGLPLQEGRHYIEAESSIDFAAALVRLLKEKKLGEYISKEARQYVQENFSFKRSAEEFEDICHRAIWEKKCV
jgi:glycosyltransferase involved in cell wall biosynthesis